MLVGADDVHRRFRARHRHDRDGAARRSANLRSDAKGAGFKDAVKDGGTVIPIGACSREGLGSKTFLTGCSPRPTAHSMVERISRDFQLGGHKAEPHAMVRWRRRPSTWIRKWTTTLSAASSSSQSPSPKRWRAGRRLPEHAALRHRPAMPHGGSTLPYRHGPGSCRT